MSFEAARLVTKFEYKNANTPLQLSSLSLLSLEDFLIFIEKLRKPKTKKVYFSSLHFFKNPIKISNSMYENNANRNGLVLYH